MKRKVLFIGCVDFSRALLEEVAACGLVSLCGVVTKRCSPFNSDFCDLSGIAKQKNIPVHYVDEGGTSCLLPFIDKTKPDVIYCFGWSQLLERKVLSAVPLGCIGYHPALLPYNRGRHPIIWALVLGLKRTGSSFFKMDEGADTGDILSQRVVPISEDDDATSLYEHLKTVAKEQVQDINEMVSKGLLVVNSQKPGFGNTWRKRSKNDGRIDFRMSSMNIRNLVRALRPPYPGAFVLYRGAEYVIGKVESSIEINEEAQFAEPGKILALKDCKVYTKTGDGVLALIEHELPKDLQEGEYFL